MKDLKTLIFDYKNEGYFRKILEKNSEICISDIYEEIYGSSR